MTRSTPDAGDLPAARDRLIELGARLVGDRGTGLELLDPDGNEITVAAV